MATSTETFIPLTSPAPAPEPEGRYEVVGGSVVEKPPMGAYEVEIACILIRLLDTFARENRLGRAVGELLFRLDPEGRLDRRPDVAFVSAARWPIERRAPRAAAWEVVPDLAVEVISPTNRTADDLAKIDRYFADGVRRVWLVAPSVGKVYDYASPTAVAILSRDDALGGGDLLPGFRLPLDELFGEPGD